MNKILLLSLLSLVVSQRVVTDDEKGPAYNPKNAESNAFCSEYFPWNETAKKWYDDVNPDQVPSGVSDCIDTLLWNADDGRYYDRCCYIRFQIDGNMHAGCIPLSEEHYLDISETIIRMENGDKRYWVAEGVNSKIYQLDCNSSYLKLLSFASIILALIF